MQSVYSWAGVICICSVIACITGAITADTKFEKTIRFILGSFMLCAVIKPASDICGVLADTDLFQNDYNIDEETDIEKIQKELINERLSRFAQDKLFENGITDINTEVFLTYNDDGAAEDISCTVGITKNQKVRIPEISRIVKETIGIAPKIVISQEE